MPCSGSSTNRSCDHARDVLAPNIPPLRNSGRAIAVRSLGNSSVFGQDAPLRRALVRESRSQPRTDPRSRLDRVPQRQRLDRIRPARKSLPWWEHPSTRYRNRCGREASQEHRGFDASSLDSSPDWHFVRSCRRCRHVHVARGLPCQFVTSPDTPRPSLPPTSVPGRRGRMQRGFLGDPLPKQFGRSTR
jgi:hypothetical protein